MKVAAGLWYLGTNSLDVAIESLERIEFKNKDRGEISYQWKDKK